MIRRSGVHGQQYALLMQTFMFSQMLKNKTTEHTEYTEKARVAESKLCNGTIRGRP